MATTKSIGRAEAVAAHCVQCIYDPGAGGTWRDQVDGCTAFGCALHAWRPQREAGNTRREGVALAEALAEKRRAWDRTI